MSQAHIPQPDATTAPSEQFTSQQTAPHGPSVSEEVPGLSPVEAISHLGEANGIDPYLYQHDFHTATFQWSTRDEPGKLLWYVPITPQSINKVMAYLSRLYVGWSGDSLFTFKIAGTGFHAGALTIVALPPTVHPNTLSGTTDYSIFPWICFDPKMLEIATIQGRDKRPINYHYVTPPGGETTSYDIGGYIAVFVQLQLNTSSSGSQNIQVQVWGKPAPNFVFSFMRPPTEDIVSNQLIVPPVLDWMLNFKNFMNSNIMFQLSSAPVLIKWLIVQPSTIVELLHGMVNCYGVDSTPLGDDNTTFHSENRISSMLTTTYASPYASMQASGNVPSWEVDYEGSGAAVASTGAVGQGALHLKDSTTVGDFNSATTTFNTWKNGTGDEFSTETPIRMFFEPTVEKASGLVSGHLHSPTANESFLVFAGGTASSNPVTSAQHMGLTRYLLTGEISHWIPSSQAALFMLQDAEEQLPIGYVKFYTEGYFTTEGSTDAVVYDIFNMRLNFVGFIQRTSNVPARTPQMSVNRLLVQNKHRSLLKASRKLQPKRM